MTYIFVFLSGLEFLYLCFSCLFLSMLHLLCIFVDQGGDKLKHIDPEF